MLTLKYRPHNLDQVVGQEQIVELIRSQSIRNEWFPVQLLYGQYGGGKTTIARIIALCANCQHKDRNGNPCLECETCKSILKGTHPDVEEIAAAVNNGVDDIRELTQRVAFKPVSLRYKVYIIDEVHMLSKGAFNALLKLLEAPPEHAMFILCTTEKSMILDTIQSRTAPYSFTSISKELIKKHVLHISAKEGFKVTDDAATVIAKRSAGSMRTALMLLEMATKETREATGESVENMLGISRPEEVFGVIRSLVSRNKAELVRCMVRLNESGVNVVELVKDLSEGMTELALASVYPDGLFGSDTYVSMAKEILVLGNTALFQAIADELVTIKATMPKDLSGQDLTVKLLGILLSDKVSNSTSVLFNMFEQLRMDVNVLKNGSTSLPLKKQVEQTVKEEPKEEISSGSVQNVSSPSESEPVKDVKVSLRHNMSQQPEQNARNLLLGNNKDFDNDGYVCVSEDEIPFKEGPVNNTSAETEEKEPSVKNEEPTAVKKEEEERVPIPSVNMFSFLLGGSATPNSPSLSRDDEVLPSVEEGKAASGKDDVITSSDGKADVSSCYTVLKQLCEEDVSFKAALSNATIQMENGKVVVRTPFVQVARYVESYLESYVFRYGTGIEGILVCVTEEIFS